MRDMLQQAHVMSALRPKADIAGWPPQVRFGHQQTYGIESTAILTQSARNIWPECFRMTGGT